jgi:hypothetical protein
MNNRTDDALNEVWEMKEKAYQDFKKSKFKIFNEFMEYEMKDLRKKHNFKYFKHD